MSEAVWTLQSGFRVCLSVCIFTFLSSHSYRYTYFSYFAPIVFYIMCIILYYVS